MIRKISGSYMQRNSYFPFAGVIYIDEYGNFSGSITEENRLENNRESTIEGRITEGEMVFYKKYFNLGPPKEHLTYILCKMNNKEYEGSWKATEEAVSFHDDSAKVIDYGRAHISISERICEICQTEEVFAKNKEFDRCLSCARKERDRLRKEFMKALTPKQMEMFKTYGKAEEIFNSVIKIILD